MKLNQPFHINSEKAETWTSEVPCLRSWGPMTMWTVESSPGLSLDHLVRH